MSDAFNSWSNVRINAHGIDIDAYILVIAESFMRTPHLIAQEFWYAIHHI